MDIVPIVDLSNDDCEERISRKRSDRKRWNELRKYIPFLEYLTKKDPTKYDKFVQLLHWFKTKKEFPLRVSSLCESTIRSRYDKLRKCTVFPPHIVAIFTEKDAIVISDDESAQPSSSNLNVLEPLSELESNETSHKVTRKSNSSARALSEDGEILSDDEQHDTVSGENAVTETTDSLSSKIVGTKYHSISEQIKRIDISGNAEDLSHREKSSWIDLEEEKDGQPHKGPILRQKNIDEDLCRRRSPEPNQLPLSLSPVSDEDDYCNASHKKKKKKHKHKKRSHQTADWYSISEVENHSEKRDKQKTIKQKIFRKTTESSIEEIEKKRKKSPKKHKEKTTICRSLYVSDDDEDQQVKSTGNPTNIAQADLSKIPEAKLFSRRETTQKQNVTIEQKKICSPVTVVLDSDEEVVNGAPAVFPKAVLSPSPHALTSVLNSNISNESVSTPCTVEASEQKKTMPSSTVLQDLHNMGLQELNDVYLKLCQTTGIQLEELLSDLVTESTKDIDIISSEKPEQFLQSSNLGPNISPNNLNNNNFAFNEGDVNHYSQQQQHHHEHQQHHHEQQQQYHHEQQQQYHHEQQQQQHHQQQQQQPQLHQLPLQMQYAPNQMRCDLPAPHPFQNSLRHGLNLNDPRIVQKLKQIKDSPIHNISIRESASILMNCYSTPSRNRGNPVVKVTSKTATTYGEHKRLRELEKQKKVEQQNAPKSTNFSNINSETGPMAPNLADQSRMNDSSKTVSTEDISKLTKRKTNRKHSSASESSVNTLPVDEKGDEEEEDTIRCISSKSRRRIESSSSSEESVSMQSHMPKKKNALSGRITPKSGEQEKEVREERVIMSFSIDRNSKRRNASSTSSQEEIVSSQSNAARTGEALSSHMTPSERDKVVGIVLSAFGKTKESVDKTLGSISRSSPKSRKKSVRKSTDSHKSDTKTSKPATENATTNQMVDLSKSCEKSPETSENYNISSLQTPQCKKRRHESIDSTTKYRSQTTPTKAKDSQPKRGCRELNNLNCTFVDYREMFERNWLPTFDGKRRCAVASSVKGSRLYQSDDSSEKSDDEIIAAPIKRRRQTCSALQSCPEPEKPTMPPIKVVIRRLSDKGTFGVEGVEYSKSFDTDKLNEEKHPRPKINKKPCIKLRRISFNEIRKSHKSTDNKPEQNNNEAKQSSVNCVEEHIPLSRSKISPKKSISGLLVENTQKAKENDHEIPILVPVSSTPVEIISKPIAKTPKYLNTDISMTLLSTKLCVLCKKRPFDLTNHYVVQHKTESYVSRLSASDIEALETNITVAVPYRKRYKVTCAFCQDELEDHFVNFHAHYSYHTGEYGFRCDLCELVKPYREDIRSHQHRASRCRNSKIRTNYLYVPDISIIYLYVCKLCNFVQLNEANIHKHHRDHHNFRWDAPEHIKRCIIAAMDYGEEVSEPLPTNDEDEALKEAVLVDREQEFLHEFPLDIKDVILTLENPESPESQCTQENELVQENKLVPPQSKLPSIEAFKTTSSTENTNNIDSKYSNAMPSPEAFLEQLHAPPALNNIMTVIHCDMTTPHHTSAEPVDRKLNIKEIKMEPSETSAPDSKSQQSRSQMCYRQLKSDSTYFGLYKCSVPDCWFSTNVSESFIQHMSSHTDEKDNISLNCAYCKFKTTLVEKLVRHVRSRHSMSLYQCSECSYRSIIPGNVGTHRTISHTDIKPNKCIYECVGRVREMKDKLTVVKKKMIDNISSLKCPDCLSSFYALSSLKGHIQSSHPLSNTFDAMLFFELACVYCKKESNCKKIMTIHLATEHPDEMAYVVERKLTSETCADCVENLSMIDISPPILPARIDAAPFTECSEHEEKSLKLDLVAKDTGVQQLMSPTETSESTLFINAAVEVITKEEQLVLDRLKPLLELLTENTGVSRPNLYRCTYCDASFFSFELWLKHTKNRHNISESISCPYCAELLTFSLVASHFETHCRHEYICYHCIQSYCSREKICEHFSSYHKNYRASIEKKVSFGIESYYIFRHKDVSAPDWVPALQNFAEEIRRNCLKKLEHNVNSEWWTGLASSCFEEVEIPPYTTNEQPRYKCLVRSCHFIGLDENALDLHLIQHTVPRNYKCSHCVLSVNSPTWESIKNHKMLHKNELHICCVCKFLHHNRSEITKHIESLHNCREVPVISLWRDEKNYKNSLSIVLPPKKFGLATLIPACFCCGKQIKNSKKFIQHLRTEHNIILFPKCEFCGKTLLTRAEAEAHDEEHGRQTFKLKYEVLTRLLYNLEVRSLLPLNVETKLKKDKRTNENFENLTEERAKPDEVSSVKVKEEVIIKTECEEEILENGDTHNRSGGLIKCINIEQLVVKEPVRASCVQEVPKRPEQGAIFLKPIAELQIPRATSITCVVTVPQYQQYQSRPQATVVTVPCTVGQVMPKYTLQVQDLTKVPLLTNLGTAHILQPSQPSPMCNTEIPPAAQTQTRAYNNNANDLHIQQQIQPKVSTSLLPQLRSDNSHSETLYTQSSVNLDETQGELNCPIIPELSPICGSCKMECTDFFHLRTHFEAVHAPTNERFLFRIERKVECLHCSFRGRLSSLAAHYATFHPNKTQLCRSVVDSRRCGMCHDIFSTLSSSNSSLILQCSCPMHQRVLADCLDSKTLKILQSFGKEFSTYSCVLCKEKFRYQYQCSKHILEVHRCNDIACKMIDSATQPILYVCNVCDINARTIIEVIEHIRVLHLRPPALNGTLADRIIHYNKIGAIYPLGLTVLISDLRNVGAFDDECFKRDVQCVEAQYKHFSFT